MSQQQRLSFKALSLLALGACQRAWLTAAAECPGSSAACQAASVDEAGGSLGLLQFSVSSHQAAGETGAVDVEGAEILNKLLAARGLVAAPDLLPPAMNCSAHPTLCGEPFNCGSNPLTPQDLLTLSTARVATEDGHSNLRSWCTSSEFEDSINKLCQKDHDLAANAQATFELQVANGVGEMDGSYCFIEGHCTNKQVTYDTTLEEAEALCDAKYGHENWTSIRMTSPLEVFMQNPFTVSFSTGFHTNALPSAFGMLACAMGNFHCDVIYCQDTYCKDPYYVERYSHYLKEYGWA